MYLWLPKTQGALVIYELAVSPLFAQNKATLQNKIGKQPDEKQQNVYAQNTEDSDRPSTSFSQRQPQGSSYMTPTQGRSSSEAEPYIQNEDIWKMNQADDVAVSSSSKDAIVQERNPYDNTLNQS